MWLSMGDSSCHCATSCGKNNKQTTVAKQKQQRHKEKEEDGKEWGEENPQTDVDSKHSSPQKDEMPGIVWATKLMVLMPSGWLSSPSLPSPFSCHAQPLTLCHTLSACPRSTQFCCRHLVTQNHFATWATTILEAAQMALEFEFECCVCVWAT